MIRGFTTRVTAQRRGLPATLAAEHLGSTDASPFETDWWWTHGLPPQSGPRSVARPRAWPPDTLTGGRVRRLARPAAPRPPPPALAARPGRPRAAPVPRRRLRPVAAVAWRTHRPPPAGAEAWSTGAEVAGDRRGRRAVPPPRGGLASATSVKLLTDVEQRRRPDQQVPRETDPSPPQGRNCRRGEPAPSKRSCSRHVSGPGSAEKLTKVPRPAATATSSAAEGGLPPSLGLAIVVRPDDRPLDAGGPPPTIS